MTLLQEQSDFLRWFGTGQGMTSDNNDLRPDSQGPDAARINPFVRKLERLAPLSAEARGALARLCTGARTVEAGSDLLRDSNAAENAYLVLDGFACRYRLRADGGRQITDYLLPGDLCDLGPLAGGSHDALGTLASSKIVRIPSEILLGVAQNHPTIEQALRRAALVGTAILREWLMNVGRRSAEERIAHLFCELYVRMQAIGLVHDNSFRLPLTQFDLGDTMGLSYVHVNRTLQALRHQGLFILKSKTLTILNPEGLQALAGFSPSYLN